MTQHVLDHCEQDLAFFNDRIDSEVISRLEQVANSPFERMEYSEAINILEQSGQTFDFPVSWVAIFRVNMNGIWLSSTSAARDSDELS